MDQKEIDALITKSQGSIAEFSKKQEALIKNLSEKKEPASTSDDADASRRGKVMGQLSRVTEEAEAGTNMVMGYMENVLNVVSKQKDFVNDITCKYKENPEAINVIEVLPFINDNFSLIEDLIFSAMDAFQFQDIGRQKLMKVMYTLSKLNEYLNELLGGHEEQGRQFGNNIDQKTLEQDKEKEEVDHIISDFKANNDTENDAVSPNPAGNVNSCQEVEQTSQTNEKEMGSTVLDNKDIDSLIAEFQQKNNS